MSLASQARDLFRLKRTPYYSEMGSEEEWRRKEERESYLSQRSHLRDISIDQSKAFDKAISLLATGALSLSAVFVNGLIAAHAQIHVLWLFAGWVALVGALMANLFSYLTGWHDHRTEIRRLDDAYTKGAQPDLVPNGFAVATGFLNWVAASSLILGIIFLLLFMSQSFPGATNA